MNFQLLNESFNRRYALDESEQLIESSQLADLRRALVDAANRLINQRNYNLKAYEVAFQDAIEGQFPDHCWWEVVDFDIFTDLFANRNPEMTIMNIVANVKPEFSRDIQECAEELVEENKNAYPYKGYRIVFANKGHCTVFNRAGKRVAHHVADAEAREMIDAWTAEEDETESLHEAEMSPEDKADSAVLRDIFYKTQQRANAALTPEEKAVLKKYNLERTSWNKNIQSIGSQPSQLMARERPYTSHGKTDYSKINYADRARKMQARDEYRRFSTDYYYDTPEHEDPKYSYWNPDTVNQNRQLRRERSAENSRLYQPVRDMKNALRDRKYHQKEVDAHDADYDAKLAALKAKHEKELADLENRRKWNGEYHSTALDNSKARIDKLLRRVESLTEGKDLTGIEGTVAHAIATNMGRYHDVVSKEDVINVTRDIFDKANLTPSARAKADQILKTLPAKRSAFAALNYVTNDLVNASDNKVIRTTKRYESVESE